MEFKGGWFTSKGEGVQTLGESYQVTMGQALGQTEQLKLEGHRGRGGRKEVQARRWGRVLWHTVFWTGHCPQGLTAAMATYTRQRKPGSKLSSRKHQLDSRSYKKWGSVLENVWGGVGVMIWGDSKTKIQCPGVWSCPKPSRSVHLLNGAGCVGILTLRKKEQPESRVSSTSPPSKVQMGQEG